MEQGTIPREGEGAKPYHDRRQIERAREAPIPSDALPKYGGHGYVPTENAVAFARAEATPATPLEISGISGVVLEARDLVATRAFYEPIFHDLAGDWQEHARRLAFQSERQRVEFVQRPRPRTVAHAGQHVAYRVRADRLAELVDGLAAAGHAASWWREDHPAERQVTAYFRDPSGNIVQLVAAERPDPLVDHYYVAVEDIEHAELFYMKALPGELESYFGYTTQDVAEARAWADGKDPCAPWTRNAFVSFRTHAPNPTPAAQLFARYGTAYIGISLTGQRLPEPPEEFLKGTPRVVLRSPQSPTQVAGYLASVRISPVSLKYDGGQVRFRREGRNIFTRDRSGNFLQIECA